MPTFTVHVPPGVADEVARADRTVLVREGFHWGAFLFGPLALLYRRLWLASLAWVVAAAALYLLSYWFGLSAFPRFLLYLVLSILTGIESNEARRGALGRRGYIGAGVLTGASREAAERLFFRNGWGTDPATLTRGARGSTGAGTPVLGVFPMPIGGSPARRS